MGGGGGGGEVRWRGEESGVPGENPDNQLWSENATYQSPKTQAPTKTRTRTLTLAAGLSCYLLVSQRLSNRLVYLRGGSAQTIVYVLPH